MTYLGKVLLYLFVALVFCFLVLPSFVVIPMSVSDSPYLQFPPRGFSWRAYQDYFGIGGGPGRWLPATIISLELAIAVVAIALPIGALAAYGLSRGSYRGKTILSAIVISPLVIPTLIIGISVYFLFAERARYLFEPLPTLAASAFTEWLILAGLGALSVLSASVLLVPRFVGHSRNPTFVDVCQRFRAIATLILVAAGAFVLLAWIAGMADRTSNGFLAADDPIPPIPMVSLGMIIAHVTLAIPYVVIILTATLRGIDVTLDRAAATLGAGKLTTFRRVILPCMAPGLAAASVFCFIVSWDELLIALFLSTPKVSTLPKVMWDGIRTEITPTVAAISSLLLMLTIALLAVGYTVETWLKRRKR